MHTHLTNGLFITFEGPEGGGKSTQVQKLADHFRSQGQSVLITREPGGTALGEKLRELIMHSQDKVCDEAELLMFAASRAQHVAERIRPHLQAGGVVLCDRFADSTTVYQGYARGLDMDFIGRLHQFSFAECSPNLTFILDLPVDTGFERVRKRRGPADRIEAESRAFHQKVRDGFLALAEQFPGRIHVLDATASIDVIHQQILKVAAHAAD